MSDYKIVYAFGWVGGYHNNTVLLNSNLKHYPVFHDLVLEHELKHHSSKDKKKFYSLEHFMHDLKDMFNLKFQMHSIMFNFRHPTSLLPFFYWKENNGKNFAIVFPWVLIHLFFVFVILQAVFF